MSCLTQDFRQDFSCSEKSGENYLKKIIKFVTDEFLFLIMMTS